MFLTAARRSHGKKSIASDRQPALSVVLFALSAARLRTPAGIEAGIFSYMGGGTARMDKTEKRLAYYEHEGDFLTVERHFTPEHTVSDLLRSFVKSRELCGSEPAAAGRGDKAGRT